MDTGKTARKVLKDSGLTMVDFSEKAGLNCSTMRDQLNIHNDNKRSTTAQAYWNAASWVQNNNKALFREAFLGEEACSDTVDGQLQQAEDLEHDVKALSGRVLLAFEHEAQGQGHESQETRDLIDHLTCAARLLRLKQVSCNDRIERGEV